MVREADSLLVIVEGRVDTPMLAVRILGMHRVQHSVQPNVGIIRKEVVVYDLESGAQIGDFLTEEIREPGKAP